MGEKFKINIKAVKQARDTMVPPLKQVNNTETKIGILRSQIDWAIKSRSNVDEEIKRAENYLTNAGIKLHQLDRFLMSSSKAYEDIERYIVSEANALTGGKNELKEDDINKYFRGLTVTLAGALANPGAWLYKNGIQFFLQERDGKIVIKAGKWGWKAKDGFFRPISEDKWLTVREKLKENFKAGKNTFDGRDVKKLMSEGLWLYNNQDGYKYKKNNYKFSKEAFPEMRTALDDFLGTSSLQRAADTFKGNVNPLDDFRGWFSRDISNLGKVAKLPGVIGVGIDVWGNLDIIRNSQGDIAWSDITFEQGKKFTVDTTVDIMSGSAAMATGAAVGSFFLPPVGTVAGIVVGGTIYGLSNWKFFGDEPKKSLVDVTKDFANKATDFVTDGFKKLDEIFW